MKKPPAPPKMYWCECSCYDEILDALEPLKAAQMILAGAPIRVRELNEASCCQTCGRVLLLIEWPAVLSRSEPPEHRCSTWDDDFLNVGAYVGVGLRALHRGRE